MLGIILSETAEVVYTIIKLSWSGGTSIYNWYYGEESEEEEEKKEIILLKNRIDTLEKKLEDK